MKINEFKTILSSKKSDLALFCNLDSEKYNPNMMYFSGYNGLGSLIIPKNRKPFLMAPKMELERAKRSVIKKVYAIDKKRFFESINILIKKNGLKVKNMAIDYNNFDLSLFMALKKQFKKAKTKDISLDLLRLRQTKTYDEIKILKKSCRYASSILRKTLDNFKDFKTESEVSAFLEYETKKLGLDTAFPPIVASGSNGSMPHYTPKNIRLKKGFCVIDFGVKYKGYCSDITRTIHIGRINNKEKGIYNFLLNIQNKTIAEIKINDNCGKIYEKCVKGLGKYSKYFIHGLGHGVGCQIHELPNLTLNSKDKISNNMVFTVEPGIYIKNRFGIRIEDTRLFKKHPIALTKVAKEFLSI